MQSDGADSYDINGARRAEGHGPVRRLYEQGERERINCPSRFTRRECGGCCGWYTAAGAPFCFPTTLLRAKVQVGHLRRAHGVARCRTRYRGVPLLVGMHHTSLGIAVLTAGACGRYPDTDVRG
jgi:hypothetical protein